jgi:hypothetical protein
VHETAAQPRSPGRRAVEQAVQDVIADERPGRVRQPDGYPGRLHPGDARLHRDRGEVRGRPVSHDGTVDRLRSRVVQNPRVVHVDGDPFDRDLGAVVGEAGTQHDIRLDLLNGFPQRIRGGAEDARQQPRVVLVCQQLDRLPGGVHLMATKRFESCDQ